MKITEELVSRTARLARLDLPVGEAGEIVISSQSKWSWALRASWRVWEKFTPAFSARSLR